MSVLPKCIARVLPDGKACADCVSFRRCAWLLSRLGTEVECDWLPSRFLDAADYEEVNDNGRVVHRRRA